MSDTPKRHSYFPRPSGPSVFASFIAIIGCMLALGLVVWLAYLPRRGDVVTVDMAQVPEDARWKYSAEGRAERLAQMHARETDMLNSYLWVDQQAGVVRVPVDRAIELVVAEQRSAKR
ncbi:MAG TPA: hypothetical protein VMM36_05645 [Opitutaceae bacterium]|nr:hypothetical protein [Opitutaceae bacterium]